MKKFSVFLTALLLLSGAVSCDFFRGIAGRPLSSEIRAKRELIQAKEQRESTYRDSVERARKDSILRMERFIADSTYAADTLLKAGKLRRASTIRNIPSRKLVSRYNIVVGAFSQEGNAARLAEKYRAAGFSAEVFRYYSGLNAVFVEPCRTLPEAMEAFRKVSGQPFASKETWILINE